MLPTRFSLQKAGITYTALMQLIEHTAVKLSVVTSNLNCSAIGKYKAFGELLAPYCWPNALNLGG